MTGTYRHRREAHDNGEVVHLAPRVGRKRGLDDERAGPERVPPPSVGPVGGVADVHLRLRPSPASRVQQAHHDGARMRVQREVAHRPRVERHGVVALGVRALRSTMKMSVSPSSAACEANRLNRAMSGWANYFHLGQVAPAYKAVDKHATRRLHQWLCRKHGTKSRKYVHFSDERLGKLHGLGRAPNRPSNRDPRRDEPAQPAVPPGGPTSAIHPEIHDNDTIEAQLFTPNSCAL